MYGSKPTWAWWYHILYYSVCEDECWHIPESVIYAVSFFCLQDIPGAMILGTDARFGNVEPERREETWNVPLNFQFGHKVKDISHIN